MGDLTMNFSRHEFQCNCGCGFDTIDFDTLTALQGCCDYFAAKMRVDRVICTITSAARCFEYNRVPVSDGGPGSNDDSQHPKGRAVDFKIHGVDPDEVYGYLNDTYPNMYGIGGYSNFTHLDTRTDGPARW